jgi:hypothetical protein
MKIKNGKSGTTNRAKSRWTQTKPVIRNSISHAARRNSIRAVNLERSIVLPKSPASRTRHFGNLPRSNLARLSVSFIASVVGPILLDGHSSELQVCHH